MKLREWKEELEKFIEQDPSVLDLEVVTASDDEGNYFNRIYYGPGKGYFAEGDFTPVEQLEDNAIPEATSNAVCLN
jgi:hypothetical protein